MPSRARSAAVRRVGAGGGIVGSSAGPAPVIAPSSAAQSATVRAIGPGWSSVGASGIIPSSGIRPWVGLIAHVPQQADGIRSEPQVSLPSAAGTIRAASAAALPPLEPPTTRSRAHGLPTWSVVPPAANSCVWVCPISTMPACLSRAQATASCARGVAVEHAARGGQPQPLDGEQVLDGDRDSTQQRRRIAIAAQTDVGRPRILAGALGIQARPGVDRVGSAVVRRRAAVTLLDSRQAGLGQLDRRQHAAAEVGVGLHHSQVGGVGDARSLNRRTRCAQLFSKRT